MYTWLLVWVSDKEREGKKRRRGKKIKRGGRKMSINIPYMVKCI
jgi:hypothetical protein